MVVAMRLTPRIITGLFLAAVVLLPAGSVFAEEDCPDPALGIYMVDRLRQGLRPTNRCTRTRARYLRSLFGDAHREYAGRVKLYNEWLRQLETNDAMLETPSTDDRPMRRTYKKIRR